MVFYTLKMMKVLPGTECLFLHRDSFIIPNLLQSLFFMPQPVLAVVWGDSRKWFVFVFERNWSREKPGILGRKQSDYEDWQAEMVRTELGNV